jgi:hypothetical protein
MDIVMMIKVSVICWSYQFVFAQGKIFLVFIVFFCFLFAKSNGCFTSQTIFGTPITMVSIFTFFLKL